MEKKFKIRSESTRQLIIEKTAHIFNKKGYAGTSLADLTEASKLTKGSIYGNFQNKEEVALVAFEYNYALRTKLIYEKLSQAKTNKEKLLIFPTLYGSEEMEKFLQNGGCPLLNFGLEVDDTEEFFRKKVNEAILNWKNNLVEIIQQGIDNQEFKPNTNPHQMALTMIALIQGAVFIGKVTKDQAMMKTALESLKQLIENICLEN